MKTLQQQTSEQARTLFNSTGDKQKHFNAIEEVLKLVSTLSNYGISLYSNLSYHQIARRTGEMVRAKIIETVCKVRDKDGSTRTSYRLV